MLDKKVRKILTRSLFNKCLIFFRSIELLETVPIEIRIESDSPDEVFSDPESDTEENNGLENFKKLLSLLLLKTLSI